MAKTPIQISKYPNRRYYDRSQSKHITLEQIRDLIRDGEEIEITDSKTGEDLTRKVMTQILLEFESEKLSLFPLPMLELMIKTNEQWVRHFIEFNLNNTVTQFQKLQDQVSQTANPFSGLSGPADNPFSAWTQALGNPFDSFFSKKSGDSSEIESLKNEIRDLREQLRQEKI
jgi:polyhydroxyalkanoate synthesis repressor PhaR